MKKIFGLLLSLTLLLILLIPVAGYNSEGTYKADTYTGHYSSDTPKTEKFPDTEYMHFEKDVLISYKVAAINNQGALQFVIKDHNTKAIIYEIDEKNLTDAKQFALPAGDYEINFYSIDGKISMNYNIQTQDLESTITKLELGEISK